MVMSGDLTTGQVLVDNRYSVLGEYFPETADLDEEGVLSCTIFLSDVDALVGAGTLTSTDGTVITFTMDVPEDVEVGEFPLVAAVREGDTAVQLLDGTASNVVSYPVLIADPLVIAELPDSNVLMLEETQVGPQWRQHGCYSIGGQQGFHRFR